ncbi:MAG: CDP-alcohol phosphatidyltransferase family protein [Deltaproteobacteria bacterium]|nr:CDP-alcohol phosphatidyltransferase family protein [Deltaproteobacteria bacterium]
MSFPLNIPNTITAVRFILTPIFVLFLIEGDFFSAFLVFIGAAVTDGLDGLIARLLKQKTTLGSYLDPIADKLMLSTAYIALAAIGIIPTWLAVVVISRDVLITMGALVVTIFKGTFMMRPSVISKATTVFQISTVILVLMAQFTDLSPTLPFVLSWLTTVFTTVSGLHYVYFGLKILNDNDGVAKG